MSLQDRVRKAETLRRVAALRQRQSLVAAARARANAELREREVAHAREVVRLASRQPVATAGDLQARQARLTALAASLADLSRESTQAQQQAEDAARAVLESTVVLRGRERLVARRHEDLAHAIFKTEQLLLDEIASLNSWKVGA